MLSEPEKTPCAIATEMPSTRPRHSCRIAPASPHSPVAELRTGGRVEEKRGARAAGALSRWRGEAKGRGCGLGCPGQLQPGVLAAWLLRVRLPRSSREAGVGGTPKSAKGGGRVYEEWRES